MTVFTPRQCPRSRIHVTPTYRARDHVYTNHLLTEPEITYTRNTYLPRPRSRIHVTPTYRARDHVYTNHLHTEPEITYTRSTYLPNTSQTSVNKMYHFHNNHLKQLFTLTFTSHLNNLAQILYITAPVTRTISPPPTPVENYSSTQ